MDAGQEIDSFSTKVLHHPENFWSQNEKLAEQCKVFVQFLFDYGSSIKNSRRNKSLSKLHTKGFDADQIWQQLEYQNALDEKNAKKLKRLLKEGFEVLRAEREESQAEEEPESDAESQEEEEKEKDDDDEKMKTKTKTKASGDFFDWDDMEKAAEEEEQSDGSEEEFGELYDSEEGEGNSAIKDNGASREEYEDFFGSSSSKNPATDSENEVEAEEKGDASNFHRRTKTVKEQVSKLEEEAMSERPWHQQGEAKSAIRPENSLLEATLDYERPVKPAPEITPEITSSLENIIRQRALDENWDDTVRKLVINEDTRPALDPLSQEKSAAGLGDIYEGQYLKANGKEEANTSSTEHAEIQQIYDELCWKLDALSNFHFTPKPLVRELDVKPAVPAISMEEVVPMATSDANLKAPEEIYGKKRGRDGNVHSKEELTQSERKAHRRAEKAKQRRKRNDSTTGKIPAAESTTFEVGKNVTKGKQSGDVSFGNSHDFFKHLNNEKEAVQSSSKINRQENAPAVNKGSSATLKL